LLEATVVGVYLLAGVGAFAGMVYDLASATDGGVLLLTLPFFLVVLASLNAERRLEGVMPLEAEAEELRLTGAANCCRLID